MKKLSTFGLLPALVLALAVQVASAQDAAKPPATGQPKPEAPKADKPASPERVDKTTRGETLDAIKKLKDDFNHSRQEFLDKEKDLKKKAAEANKADREKIRGEIKEKRQEFLQKQKEAHEEIRKQASELKDKLKDHREVIDEAKEKAKERAKDNVKARKGGSD